MQPTLNSKPAKDIDQIARPTEYTVVNPLLKNKEPPASICLLQDNRSKIWPKFLQQEKEISSSSSSCGIITEEELSWMKNKRSLQKLRSMEQFVFDYGEEETEKMFASLEQIGLPQLAPVFNWPGVATRYQAFVDWAQQEMKKTRNSSNEEDQKQQFVDDGGKNMEEEVVAPPASSKGFLPPSLSSVDNAFAGFAQHLGRVTIYRALSLEQEALDNILKANEIFPTGLLRISVEELSKIVETQGIRKIVVARLFIAHLKELIGYDPSLSLHEEWQTTTSIASGYCSSIKPVYLFEVSVPAIESLGYTLQEVAAHALPFLGEQYANHEPWFNFKSPALPNGTWFDATILRTERYGLWTIPFLKTRLGRLWKFSSKNEITAALEPFVQQQVELRTMFPFGEAFGKQQREDKK